jgi:hypothetical protein
VNDPRNNDPRLKAGGLSSESCDRCRTLYQQTQTPNGERQTLNPDLQTSTGVFVFAEGLASNLGSTCYTSAALRDP